MIESAKFTHVNGTVINLNDSAIPFRRFLMDVDLRIDEQDRSQEHGIWPSNTYFGKRKFSIEGDLLAADYAPLWTLRNSLLAAILPDPDTGSAAAGVLELQFTGMSEAVIASCVIDSYPELPLDALTGSRGDFQINFKSFDPRLYGKTLNNVTASTSSVILGRTYNKTYNRSYAQDTFTGNIVTVNNVGNYPTYLTATINGPGYQPALWYTIPGGGYKKVILKGLTVQSGQSVTLDFLNRTAIMNNGVNVYSTTVGSEWFKIPKGTSTVRLIWGSNSIGANAVLTWRNAYML